MHHNTVVGLDLPESVSSLVHAIVLEHDGMSETLQRRVQLTISVLDRAGISNERLDVGGDDTYRGKEGNRPGMAVINAAFRGRGGVSTYFADSTSIGLFLDVGGTDTYDPPRENDTHWLDPADSPNRADRNFSVGVDRADGGVGLEPIPEKRPSGSGARFQRNP